LLADTHGWEDGLIGQQLQREVGVP
jgi:hypothetical protein